MKKLMTLVLLLATVVSYAQVPSYVPSNGLLAYWPFNGSAIDASGNGKNGVVNGALLTSDRFGNPNRAYRFNGINNTIAISNSSSFNFTNGLAISFWMNISSYPVSDESIIFSQQISSSTSAIGFNVSISTNGKLNYRIGNGGLSSFAGCLNNSVNLNQWYHVVCQIQNGIMSVCLNGQIVCSANQPNAVVGSPNIPMIMGDDTWGAGNAAFHYSGIIDDVAIYNRALTQQEITALFLSNCEAKLLCSATTNTYQGKAYFTECTNLSAASINFADASTINSPTAAYRIIWGDGTTDFTSSSFSGSTVHTYNVGTYLLKYIVVSGNCIDTTDYNIFVGSNPVVGLSNPGNTSICTGTSLTFPITYSNSQTGISNTPGTIYTITFNDGTPPITYTQPITGLPPASITHVFDTTSCGIQSQFDNNSFQATIKAENPCGISTAIVSSIYVSSRSKASITSSSSNIICSNASVAFANSSIAGNNVRQNFPLGSCSSAKSVWSITPTTGWFLESGSLGNTLGSNNPNAWASGTSAIQVRFVDAGNYTVKIIVGANSICGNDSSTTSVQVVNGNFFPQDTIKACGSSYALDAGAGSSYSWNTGATSRTINVTNTGRYRCTVTTNNCEASDSVFVSLVNANVINNDTSICSGQSVTLNANTITTVVNTGALIAEQFLSFTGPSSFNINNLPAGDYIIEASGTFCIGSCWIGNTIDPAYSFNQTIQPFLGSFSINEYCPQGTSGCNYPRPISDIYNPDHIYYYNYHSNGGNLTIYGIADECCWWDNISGLNFKIYKSLNTITYLWSTGATTPTITVSPSQSTTYNVTVSNGISSCRDSVRVNVTNVNRNFFPQDTIRTCGNSLTLDAGTGNSYSWSTGATTRTIIVSNSGRYRCTVTTNNCTETDSVFVSIVRANIINNDTTINAGSSLTLIADSSSFGTPRPTLLWSTGSTTTRTTVTPQAATTYTLRVTNGSSSCTDSVRVNVNLQNAFTISAATSTACGPSSITPNSTIDVPVTVRQFTRMVGLQGSMKWDSTVLRYQGISSFAPGIGLATSNFNSPAANTLTFSWVDGSLAGQTLADSAILFTIRFNLAANSWSRSTAISFENQPTPLEAVQSPSTVLGIAPQAGNVRITARPVFDTTRLSGCGSVQYNGANYTSSTTLNNVVPGPTGCDSISRTVIITVIPVPVINPVTSNSPLLIGETLRFTVTGQNLDGGTFTWTGPGNFFSNLQNPTLTATANASGQYRMIYSSTCRRDTQTVSVTVNAGISGRIVSPLNQPIQRVNLLRNNVPTLVNGSYSIAVNPASPLVLKAAKNNDVNKLNGVSVIDIVLIQNHILQRTLLNSPYKIIAADVNRSNSISTLDLVLMQRLILGFDTTFPGNNLWAFADSSFAFPNPANPFPYKDSFSYTSATLQTNRANQTFIGMKLGDVNYDWNAQQLRPVPTEDVTLYHDDVQLEGNTIRIPIKVKNLKDLLGMQFTLQYNSSALRFRNIENNRLNLKYGNTRNGEGLLSFIWSDDQNRSVTLNDDAVLMELVFDKAGEFSSEDIQLVNTIAPIEAWDKNYRKHNIIKGRGRILNNTKPGIPGWTVSPNPSTGQVVVSLTLQKAQSVELYLTSADGRVLKTWKQAFAAGITAWPLDLKSGGYLPAGMYWLKMPGVDAVVRKVVVE